MNAQIIFDFFAELENTSKRLEMIAILADLYKAIEFADDAKKVTYLLQGRVAAFYEPVEFGMGERLLERVVAESFDLKLDLVQKLNGELGDIALVGEKFAIEKEQIAKHKISVENVFSSLVEIAAISGEGSVDEKVSLLAELLKNADVVLVKYLLRIVSGRLRLGVGDPTVLEGISLAKLGDRKYRKELERAYNEISDLGVIAETIWSVESGDVDKILDTISKLTITVGRPLRSQLCERLPSPEVTIEKMSEVVSQFKYDGFRTQMHLDRKTKKIRLFSRNLEETTSAFPELVEGLLNQVDADSVILDSEALAYHPESEEFFPFQETTKRRRKHGIDELAQILPLKAFVFDILYKNGESLLNLTVRERLEILSQTVKSVEIEKQSNLIVSESRVIDKADELGLMLEEALSKGLEGIVVKKVNSPYEAGARNYNWVKLKHAESEQLRDTVDCVVLGYIFGRGKRTAFGVGALLVGVYDAEKDMFVSVSKIGTGLTDEEWVSVRERCDKFVRPDKPARVDSNIVPSVWVEPEVVIEVLADEITRSPIHTAGSDEHEVGYALRFPRLVSFRDADKKAEDATNVVELIELFKMQRKNE